MTKTLAGIAVAVVVGFIVVAFVAFHDSHQGEHCVRSEPYTYFIQAGKVMVPATGMQCVEWAPDEAAQR